MIVVDGSFGEGGGQILRTAIGISAALGKPVKIVNIRARRRNPGLQPQHLTAVKALAQIASARVDGAYIGSTQLVFEPRGLRGGEYIFDVGTAGSVTLVLQALAPVLPFLDRETVIELRGGTDVPWSPPIDYIKYVFIPIVKRLGLNIGVDVVRRGHYPRGGGIVRVYAHPAKKLVSVELVERGSVIRVGGKSHCVKLPKHVAERQANAAKEFLASLSIPVDIELEFYEPGKDPHLGPGSGIVLYAETEKSILGADSLGEKGKPAEVVGREAAEKLLEEIGSGAALDSHMGDMMVSLACLAKGVTKYTTSKLTLHTETVLKIAQDIAGCNYTVSDYGKAKLIEIRGIGL
ncbi:RNA 3'-terminal phosphate cyclase [Ignisphaera sp. 4213-co]|uniref:RNA 3'-terminal phosphate cyclase n=1 Tax=Ignisphaera cupida TaxID=3050454 RepID=A0ABD4Z3V4_9CREN|nr:RNA 3'-terminal phosphate cyclase [Ignisphaera sp. 4213-co]MDK6027830.1 RNA 3'-terminal phosphate cyclase [Ignisphaera sp. 4213-co]